MAPFNSLPPELLHHIFSYLDPKSLKKANEVSRLWHTTALNNLLWKQLTYKPAYQKLCVNHLKGAAVFESASWHHLKKEYKPLHPLYKAMRELTAMLNSTQSETQKATVLQEKAAEGAIEDKIRYVKAIIASNQFHTWLFEYPTLWLDFLTENITLKAPEIVPQLLASPPLQEYLASDESMILFLETMLIQSNKGLIDFFTNPSLQAWREDLFARSSHWYVLKNLLDKIIAQHPDTIPSVLEDKAFQKFILSPYYTDDLLYNALLSSKEGPVLLLHNPKLAIFKEMLFSALSKKDDEELKDNQKWFSKKLVMEHKRSDQLIISHPETLNLLNYYEIKEFVNRYPEKFKLTNSHAQRHLLITTDQTNLNTKLDLLKNDAAFLAWFASQSRGTFVQHLSHALYSEAKDRLPEKLCVEGKSTIFQKGSHTNSIQPIFIEREHLHTEYLLSLPHRNLIDQEKFTLLELLRLTPSEFLEAVSAYNIGRTVMILFCSLGFIPEAQLIQSLQAFEKYREKLNVLYATYTSLNKDEKDFLKNQSIGSFSDFIKKAFSTEQPILEQLIECNFESLFSLSIRSMIQTNHITFESACKLVPSDIERAKVIDATLDRQYSRTARPVHQAQQITKSEFVVEDLQKAPNIHDINFRLNQLSCAVNRLHKAFFQTQTVKHQHPIRASRHNSLTVTKMSR